MENKLTGRKGFVATREAVDKLKEDWERDPVWDLPLTEGYGEYYDELVEFARDRERYWEHRNRLRRQLAEHNKEHIDFGWEILKVLQSIEEKINRLIKKEGGG